MAEINPITGVARKQNSVPNNTIITPSSNNPYQGIDYTAGLSRFQKWLDKHGITNYAGQLKNQYDLLSNQWESENKLKLADREFNDYESNVARMRAAGLNPDLLGVSGYESQISGNSASDDIVPLSESPFDAIQKASPIFSTMASLLRLPYNAVMGAIGMASGILQIEDLYNSTQKNYTERFNKDVNTVLQAVIDAQDAEPDYDNGIVINGINIDDFLTGIRGRRYKRAVSNEVSRLYNLFGSRGKETKEYNSKSNYFDAKNRYIEGASIYPSNNVEFEESIIENLRDVNKTARYTEYVESKFMKEIQPLLHRLQKNSVQYENMGIADMLSNKDVLRDNEVKRLMNKYERQIQEKQNQFLEKHLNGDSLIDQLIVLQLLNSRMSGALSAPFEKAAGLVQGMLPSFRFGSYSHYHYNR